jgi:hypothetical protein
MRGIPRSGETNRPVSKNPVASGVKCGSHGGKKSNKVVDKSRCRVAAHDRSLHEEFAAIHHKTVGLLG